jgi:hypothetical protein
MLTFSFLRHLHQNKSWRLLGRVATSVPQGQHSNLKVKDDQEPLTTRDDAPGILGVLRDITSAHSARFEQSGKGEYG